MLTIDPSIHTLYLPIQEVHYERDNRINAEIIFHGQHLIVSCWQSSSHCKNKIKFYTLSIFQSKKIEQILTNYLQDKKDL